MIQIFLSSGKSTEVQLALKKAILDSTGADQVLDVPVEKIHAAYAAVMEVKI